MVQLAEWATEESAFGGWLSAKARVARSDFINHPDVIHEGSEVHSRFRENGEYLFWGELGTPNDNGGVIDLDIEGPYQKALDEVKRLFFGAYGTEGWTPEDGETIGRHRPHTKVIAQGITPAGVGLSNGDYRYKTTFVTPDGETRGSPRSDLVSPSGMGGPWEVEIDIPGLPGWASAVNIYRTEDGGSDYKFVASITDGSMTYFDTEPDFALGVSIPTSFEGAAMQMQVHKDSIVFKVEQGAVLYAGQLVGMAFPVPRQSISGLSFSANPSRASTNYTLLVNEADDEDSPWRLTDSWAIDDDDKALYDTSTVRNDSSLVRIAVRVEEDIPVADALKIVFSDLKVFGLAPDDEYTCTDGARDIAALLGVSDRGVRECGVKMLPGDFIGGNYADIMTWLCALTGFCWGIIRVKGQLVMFFRPFGRRVWHVLDPEMPRKLDMMQRYSKAVVSFPRPDGTFKEVDAVADPNLLGTIRTAPTFHVNRHISTEQAEILAQRLADRYVQDNRFGTATLSRVYRNGIAYHPYFIRPGDQLYWPSVGVTLNVTQQSKNPPVLEVTFPDGFPELDRFEAKEEHKAARSA